jgi:TolB protein
MNPDGSNARQLTENRNNDGLPAWSPDGTSIAYVSDQGGAWAVWVMNTDGRNQRKLFAMKDEPNSRGWLEERISWAP